MGKRVGSPIVAVDADEDDTLRYSVTGGDGASIFDVGSCDGQVSIKKAEVDYETQKTYTLKVTVTDDGENPDMLTDSAEITILVTDVNEPPRVSDYTCVFPEADDAARREAASIRLSGGENELMGVLEDGQALPRIRGQRDHHDHVVGSDSDELFARGGECGGEARRGDPDLEQCVGGQLGEQGGDTHAEGVHALAGE